MSSTPYVDSIIFSHYGWTTFWGSRSIVPQTRIETFGNNGTSANRYILISSQPDLHKSGDTYLHSDTPLSSSFMQCRKMLLAAIGRAATSSSPLSGEFSFFESGAEIRRFFPIQCLKTFFGQWMTPSPMSSLTPKRTIPKRKKKQRKEYFPLFQAQRKFMKLYTKWIQ
jgi:hypothetical protein